VVAGLADETPIPQGPAREAARGGTGSALRGRDAERLLNRLKDWRNNLIARDNAAPITIAANGLLKEITRRAPRTLEELATVADIRAWQIETHGAALVRIVNEILEDSSAAPAAEEGAVPAKPRRRRRRSRRPGETAPAAE
jgi:ribonuclease D